MASCKGISFLRTIVFLIFATVTSENIGNFSRLFEIFFSITWRIGTEFVVCSTKSPTWRFFSLLSSYSLVADTDTGRTRDRRAAAAINQRISWVRQIPVLSSRCQDGKEERCDKLEMSVCAFPQYDLQSHYFGVTRYDSVASKLKLFFVCSNGNERAGLLICLGWWILFFSPSSARWSTTAAGKRRTYNIAWGFPLYHLNDKTGLKFSSAALISHA